MDLLEHIDQKLMVFLVAEAADVADHKFAFQPQFLAQGCPFLGVEGELFQIDGIVEDPEPESP